MRALLPVLRCRQLLSEKNQVGLWGLTSSSGYLGLLKCQPSAWPKDQRTLMLA
jgi:hypothetical protein